MNIKTFSEVKSTAHAKWREYRNAEKAHKDNKMYTELKKLYWRIKRGEVLFDIQQVIKAGGMHDNWHPKLAICRANAKTAACMRRWDGAVTYRPKDSHWYRDKAAYVELPAGVLPAWKREGNAYQLELEAPLPLIPPRCMPSKLTDDHYILWEVDEWKLVPPTDPYLCRRITKYIFAIEAQWNLTELEKTVMAGRMH